MAWDAALRGLKVGLIERGDFASGTSSNSLKIVHGGFRYLQQLDLPRMRESIAERTVWLRAAPHLVEPLPVLIPTYRSGIQRKALLRIASLINDAVSWDRNRGLAADRLLPTGRTLSRTECLDLVPELSGPGLTGGVLLHDAQMYSSERLVLEVVAAAASAGATVANYVSFEGPLRDQDRLIGVHARELVGGDDLEIRAAAIVNATGSAVGAVAERLTGQRGAGLGDHSLAMNLIVPTRGHAVAFAIAGGVEDPDTGVTLGRRQYFLVPWRNRLLVGTGHYPYSGNPTDFSLREAAVARYLTDVNASWPGEPFARSDVLLVHSGLIPTGNGGRPGNVSFLKRHRLVDHSRDGEPRLVTVATGKYTTARRAAEDAVDLVVRKLDRRAAHCSTATSSLPGAPADRVSELVAEALRGDHGLESDVVEHLVRVYGRGYGRVLDQRGAAADRHTRVDPGAPVILAQWVNAIRHEAAVRPEDLVWRRTELGARGLATEALLRSAARTLASERSGEGLPNLVAPDDP